MTFPILETERLKLIEVGPEYAERLFEIFSLDEVTRYYGMENLMSVEQAEKMISSFATGFAEKKSLRWGVILKETGEFIGTVGLNNLQLWAKRTEVGYETHPSYWRGGYTSEALNAILRYSFEELGVYRIAAVTFPDNLASSGMLRKNGFQQEGILRGYLRQNGESHDAAIFSMIKPDWEGR